MRFGLQINQNEQKTYTNKLYLLALVGIDTHLNGNRSLRDSFGWNKWG